MEQNGIFLVFINGSRAWLQRKDIALVRGTFVELAVQGIIGVCVENSSFRSEVVKLEHVEGYNPNF